MSKVLLLAVFISSMALSSPQECNPRVVEWFPHPRSCQRFILCFHGNPLGKVVFNLKACQSLKTYRFCRAFMCSRAPLFSNWTEMHFSRCCTMWHQLHLPWSRRRKKSRLYRWQSRLPQVSYIELQEVEKKLNRWFISDTLSVSKELHSHEPVLIIYGLTLRKIGARSKT